ncbi:MAG: prepilin-type N-terminal cleavage/methylation domain-containing protein [Candidatus Peribacteria bacterium]|nr:prepilin-type N-terminal cleavage/methylation domain-containing protein [Candidatus Peribacteria bacterium]
MLNPLSFKFSTFCSKSSAFTLAELIIVIVILAIL